MGNTIIAIAVHSLIIQLFIIQLSQSTSVLYDIVYIKVYVYIYNYMMFLAIFEKTAKRIYCAYIEHAATHINWRIQSQLEYG